LPDQKELYLVQFFFYSFYSYNPALKKPYINPYKKDGLTVFFIWCYLTILRKS